MKKVEAVIRPFKVDEVKDALTVLGVGGMTVSKVRGVGREPERTGHYGGAEYTIDLLPKAKVEVVVADDLVESVVSTICKAARSLMDPPGLSCSHLMKISHPVSSLREGIRRRGVFPINADKLLAVVRECCLARMTERV